MHDLHVHLQLQDSSYKTSDEMELGLLRRAVRMPLTL
jgi:hypothetical protein